MCACVCVCVCVCVCDEDKACVHTKSLQSCLTLYNPMDCSPPGSSVHGILQQEYWTGWPCPPPGDLPDPGIERTSLASPALAGRFFTTSNTGEALGIRQALPNSQRWQMIANIDQLCVCSVTQLCPTPRDLMDCSPPGSSVCGIFQPRRLE